MNHCDYCGKEYPSEQVRAVALDVGPQRTGAVILCHGCGDDLGVVDLFDVLSQIARFVTA